MFQLFDQKNNHSFPLTGLIKEIGRTSECDICLPDDAKISRRHARLEWNGQTWVLLDEDSTNGTFVNGERVSERELRAGDVLEIGDYQLRYLPLPVADVAAIKKTTEVMTAPSAEEIRRRAQRRGFAEGSTVPDRKERKE
jgi:pSer/pThr/pTyr-binding forkhead associated (FHA) protein